MAKYWLRGILLGVSLALLLAGGVALAQTMTLEIDQDCVECYPAPYEPDHALPPDEYLIYMTLDGWDPQYNLCNQRFLNGEALYDATCGFPPLVGPPFRAPLFWGPCEIPDAPVVIPGLVGEVSAEEIEEFYGEWELRMWQPGTENEASVTWRFVEDCQALQFVPEPGTLALLSGGLAGLAGYASLRWRNRGR